MITLNYDFAEDFFQYKVVPTYWNDAINIITSEFQDRIGFKFLADFYLENTYVGTIKNQPFNNIGQVQINSFTKNLLSYDANWKSFASGTNPNSFKNVNICYGEEFSRKLRFISVTPSNVSSSCTSSTALRLNFDEPTMLRTGDRVYVTKDVISINPQYNGFAKVLSYTNSSAVISKTYSYSQFTESGYVWEGVEFFDYFISPNGYDVAIRTTNDHNLNIGDQIYLQMDGDARSSIVVTASFGDQCSFIRLYDPTYTSYINIATYSVNFTSTFEQFLTDIVNQINCEQPQVGGFSAWYYGTGSNIFLTAPFGSGSTYNGYIPAVFRIGGNYTVSTMSNAEGYDSNGQGLNPQLSDIYSVKDILSSNSFTINKIPNYYNNWPGSERGTVYSMNNYKRKSLLCGTTFSLMHASFTQYDPYMYNANSENMVELSWVGIAADGGYGTPNLAETKEIILNDYSNCYTVDILNHHAIQPYDDPIDYCILETYDSTGSIIQSFTISNFGILSEEKLSLGWGPFNLNLLRAISPLDFNPIPVGYPINTSVKSYKIAAYDTNNYKLTHTFSFKIEQACEPMQITWLNTLGGWEYMPIETRSSKETMSISRNNYDKVGNYVAPKVGTWGDPSYDKASITYDETKRGTTTYNILAASTYQITTPFLKVSEFEDQMVKDMLKSPEVYIIYPGSLPVDDPYYDPEIKSNQPIIVPVTILDEELVMPQATSKIIYYRITFKTSQYKNSPIKTIGN